MNEYMTDEELLSFISDIEENDLVIAPPHIEEAVFSRLNEKSKIVEYRKFRSRVIVSIAAILIIGLFAPAWLSKGLGDSYRVRDYVAESNILSDLNNSHYISNLINGREE